MPTTPLHESLQRLKRRLLVVGSAAGVAWGAAAGVMFLAGWIWLDLIWELSGALRAWAVDLAVMTAGVAALAVLVAALRRTRNHQVSRQLDQVAGTGGQILSGYELLAAGRSAQRGAASGPEAISAGLATLAVERAADLAAEVAPAAAVPARPAARAAAALLVILVAGFVLLLAAPRLVRTQWLRFTDPHGDHPPFSLTQFQVEPGNTRVVYGSGLEVLVRTLGRPVEQVELVLSRPGQPAASAEALPMFPEAGGKWRASIAEVTAAGEYYVRASPARSHKYSIGVITVPRLKEVRWRVTPPAYTGDAVYEGPMPQGGLSGLPETKVEVWASSNRPLSGGLLQLSLEGARQQIRLRPQTRLSKEVGGTFTIRRPGKLSLHVTDVARQDSRERFSGTITILTDARPFVRLLEPAAQSFATPQATLPVALSAEDDYGISGVQLFRSLNDSRALPLDLPVESPAPRRSQHGTFLPLSVYGLAAGDVIKLYARVEDNDPAGAKGSESPVAMVQIIAPEDYERLLRAREGMEVFLSKYQQAQRRMESLAEELDGLKKELEEQPAGAKADQRTLERLERTAKRLREEAAAVRESAAQLLPYDLDKSLSRELEQLAKRLDEAAEQAEQLASQDNHTADDLARELSGLLAQLQREQREFGERVTEPLERLADIYPLLEDSARFEELVRRQRDLADRLASLEGRDNQDDPALKARMRDLEEEQRALREELTELLDDVENHAARVPDSPEFENLVASALEFADAVRASGASEAMSEAETGLAEFSGTRGHAGAAEAARILEQFLSRCRGMGQGAAGACRGLKFAPGEGGEGAGMGQTLEQLLADAGFGTPGAGRGQGAGGAGGGYSARRSTLSNVGLYGNLPTRGNPAQSGGGRGRLAQSGRGGFGQSAEPGQSSRLDPGGMLRAAGASEAAIPVSYRDRVFRYFERIAEEVK